MKIAYICDGLDKCSDKVGCYRVAKPGMDYCTHTCNPEHAKNGAVDDPRKYPERFYELDVDNEEIHFWEGEFNI